MLAEQRLVAAVPAPVDAALWNLDRLSVLESQLAEGSIAGLPPGVVAVDRRSAPEFSRAGSALTSSGAEADEARDGVTGEPRDTTAETAKNSSPDDDASVDDSGGYGESAEPDPDNLAGAGVSTEGPSEPSRSKHPVVYAYRWTDVKVKSTGAVQFTMRLKQSGRVRGKQQSREFRSFRLMLPGLVAFWRRLLDDACGPNLSVLWRQMLPQTMVPDLSRSSDLPAQLTFRIGAETAAEFAAQGRGLTQSRGLALDWEEAVLNIAVTFMPLDPAAAELFAVDDVVRRVVAPGGPLIDDAIRLSVRELPAEHAERVTAERVKDRMWKIGHLATIYRMREEDDFSYGEWDESAGR
jgi:hypothetical protein